jgi:hypothetical protein
MGCGVLANFIQFTDYSCANSFAGTGYSQVRFYYHSLQGKYRNKRFPALYRWFQMTDLIAPDYSNLPPIFSPEMPLMLS